MRLMANVSYDIDMKFGRGFTVIELAVVLAVIAILLVVGTVSFRSYQASARDKERHGDVQAISVYLETIYQRQIFSGATLIKPAGSYPSAEVMNNPIYKKAVFVDLPTSNTRNPASPVTDAFVVHAPTPSFDDKMYKYVPVVSGGGYCVSISDECRSYKIYYGTETESDKTVESKRK